MPTNVFFDANSLLGFLLTLTRVGSALLLLPFPGFQKMLEPARILFILSCSLCLFPVWADTARADAGLGLVPAVLLESSMGLMVGLISAFLFESFQIGAQVISFQAGFGFASTIDPQSEADSNVLQATVQLFSGFLFFSLGLHEQVLRMLGFSFQQLNPATIYANDYSVASILILGSKMFATGLRLALPVVGLVFSIDLALSVLTRLHAQLQLMTLAFPVKIVLTLFFVCTLIGRWPRIFESVAAQMFARFADLATR